MLCPNCKTNLPDNAVFCVRCGISLQNDSKVAKPHRSKGKLLLLLLLIVVFAILFIKYNHYFFDEDNTQSNVIQSGSINNGEQALEIPIQKNNKNANNDILKIAPVCDSYMNVQTDEKYLYFRTNYDFYRMNKDTYEVELVFDDYINLGEVNGESIICSVKDFGLTEDYLYFSLKPIPMNYSCAYFRIPKEGGEVELLFLLPQSYIVVNEEKLYFLFKDSNEIGVYDPKKDTMPKFIPVVGHTQSEYQPTPPFSVIDGYLYYSANEEEKHDKNYYRTNLTSKKRRS